MHLDVGDERLPVNQLGLHGKWPQFEQLFLRS